MSSPPLSFRTRIAALFGLMAIAVGLPLYLYITHFYRDQLVSDRRAYLQSLTSAAATVLSENLIERRREIELLAQTPLYRDAPLDSTEFRTSLERLQKSYPQYSWIGLTDPQGRVRAATSNHLVGQNVSQRPWFGKGLQAVYVGDVHEAKLLSNLVRTAEDTQPIRFIDFAAPVLDKDGNVRAVLGSHAHWRWAGEAMKVVRPANAGELGLDLFIVNQQGVVIYPEDNSNTLKVPELGQLASTRGNGFLQWENGQPYLTAAASISNPVASYPLGWRVVARQPERTVVDDVRELQTVILIVTGVASVVFLVLIWIAADSLSRPLGRLAGVARQIERGDANVVFESKQGSVELQRLSSALQGMHGTLSKQKEALAESNRDLEAKVAQRTQELHQLNQRLHQQARFDALTGLPNRLQTTERLHSEFTRFQRDHVPYTLLMIDVDHFKKVNDTHGHASGDAVLKQVAGVLQDSIRETDLAGRLGGEEFLVILPMTGLAQGLVVAEKIRASMAALRNEPVGHITVSIGVQEASADDEDQDTALNRADHWLYQAKAAGRNQVLPDA